MARSPRAVALRGPRAIAAVALVAALLGAVLSVAPATAALAAAPGVSTSTPSVSPGAKLTIDFSTDGAVTAKDWIGLYSSGAIQDRCPSPSTYWGYTSSGTHSVGAKPVASGSLVFDTAGWAPGVYSVYLCRNDGYTAVGTPITVEVAIPTPTPTPDGRIWPTLPSGFVSDTLHLPAVKTSAPVSQRLAGLWNGPAPRSFAKDGGADWLSVSSDGIVTGTAPATDAADAEIAVTATDGAASSRILVEIPVSSAPKASLATWNAWAAGARVTDAVGKTLAALASRGIGLVAFQDGGDTMAAKVGEALGWNVATSSGLGVVSAYPLSGSAASGSAREDVSAEAPAFAVTANLFGRDVRIWDAGIDESAPGDTGAAQARAIADLVRKDAATAAGSAAATPVVVLGDLGDASRAPLFVDAGLTDAYRAANPDETAAPGATWPVFPAAASSATRIDYVFQAGPALKLVDADQLIVGWPSAASPAGNSWPSDHAAVVATFVLADAGPEPTLTPTPGGSTGPSAPPPSAGGSNGSGGSGALPTTGFDPLPFLGIAGLLLLGGLTAFTVTQVVRRRARD